AGITSSCRKPIRSRSGRRARPRTSGTSSRSAPPCPTRRNRWSRWLRRASRIPARSNRGVPPSGPLPMQFAFLLEQVVNGLVLGGYYLLIALGLSLIFSVGGIVNLAHGAFYALGAYASVEITKYLGFGPAIVLSPAAVALLGIVFERFILRRFYTADPILSLLVTFGLAMVAEQPIRIIWGAAPLSASIPPAFRGSVFVGDFLFSRYRLLILAVVAAMLLGVWLLLHKTSFGRVVRAGIQRPDMVAALGIRLQ